MTVPAPQTPAPKKKGCGFFALWGLVGLAGALILSALIGLVVVRRDSKRTAEAAAADPRSDPAWQKTPAGQLCAEHRDWAWDACKIVGAGHVAIGLTAEQCLEAWGRPRDVNRTVTAAGTREQWCYGELCKPALYFDDGTLTAIQN